MSGVGRPQGNGKVERVFQTLERLRGRFECLQEAVRWYNEQWPHARLGGRAPLQAETDREVFAWMEGRLPRFRNLLTDNGSQFDRANGRARAYCHASGTHHIWSTPGHPQTLGKVGRVQKDLKRILVLAG
jgi:transposase InsO family protein